MTLSVILAVVSAALLALASTIEQNAAQQRPQSEALRLPLLARLARDPRWLLGIGLALLSFPIEASALGLGRLVVVEPILAGGIALAVLMQWVVYRRRPRVRDLFLAAFVAAALAMFLALGRLTGSAGTIDSSAWLVVGMAIPLVALAAAVLALRKQGEARAGLLGMGAGALFGLQSALVKATVGVLAHGPLRVFVDWHVYALVATGVCALVVEQSAYQTGKLAPSVSATKLMTAVTAVVLGVVLFDERISSSGARLAVAIGALLAAFVGLVALSRDQAILEEETGSADRPNK